MSDIDTAVVDGLKALDPKWPIREADMKPRHASLNRRGPRTSSDSFATLAGCAELRRG